MAQAIGSEIRHRKWANTVDYRSSCEASVGSVVCGGEVHSQYSSTVLEPTLATTI